MRKCLSVLVYNAVDEHEYKRTLQYSPLRTLGDAQLVHEGHLGKPMLLTLKCGYNCQTYLFEFSCPVANSPDIKNFKED
jgi:hypothetical protein